jgi:hypothetical protein
MGTNAKDRGEVKPRLITHFEPWYVLAVIRIKRYSDVFYDLTDIDQKEFLLAPPSVGLPDYR